MKKHKTSIIWIIFALLVSSLPTVIANPVSGSNDNYDYLLGGTDFSKFSLGLYSKKRVVLIKASPNLSEYEMSMKKTSAYIGYDALRWATAYITFGNTDTRLDTGYYPLGYHQTFNGAEGEAGCGVVLNLIDHDIADPTLIEDRIRVNANIEYTGSKAYWKYASKTVKWSELYASLTMSLINQIHGSKEFWPHALAFYGGPVYSRIISADLKHDGEWGFTGGFSIMYSENVTINLGYEQLEGKGYTAGANIRF